jgi:hypothetical protein
MRRIYGAFAQEHTLRIWVGDFDHLPLTGGEKNGREQVFPYEMLPPLALRAISPKSMRELRVLRDFYASIWGR